MSAKLLAVITGASSGIGAVYADRLAARGFDLLVVARRGDRLNELASKLSEKHHVRVEPLVADLADDEDLRRVEQRLKSDTAVAVLVNNAGNGKLGATAAMSDADAANTLALNIGALTRLSRAVLPGFLARDAGTLINIGSVLGLRALSLASLYSGTKAYVLNFTRGLQLEVEGAKVKVQAVLPAGTATEFYDHAGIPISAFDPAAIMSAEALVDAALAGLDSGEAVTLPSVHDIGLWETYEAASVALFAATQDGRPAPRYVAKAG